MLKVTAPITRALLALHGWLAVCLGLLLYVVILTGTLAVFEREIGAWANPLPRHAPSSFVAGTDPLLRELAGRIDPDYRDEVALFPAADGRLRAFFHTHGDDGEERGMLALIDPTGPRMVSEREGAAEALLTERDNTALTDFLVDLHVRLLMPGQWGLLLTGVLGFAMLAAVISGFVLHRHLLAELFTLRRRGDALLTARDKHVLAGAWNLPFAFVLAFTGAFFSFGGAIGLPAIAYVAFGGDVEAMSNEVLSPSLPPNPGPAPLVNLDALLDDARARSGAEPTGMLIQHWGRVDASIQLSLSTPEGRLLPSHFAYAGATGEFLGASPPLGTVPSLGGELASLMSPLHFGNFAGLYSKVIWFAFGFAGAYVSLTGLSLWTARRRHESGWLALGRATLWVGYGLPVTLAGLCAAYFAARLLGQPAVDWLLPVFGGLALLTGTYSVRCASVDRGKVGLLAALSVLLLAAPVLRFLATDLGWLEALGRGQAIVAGVDAVFLVGAVLCFANARRARRASHRQESTVEPLVAVEGL